MNKWDPSQWVLVITTVSTAVCSIIAAIKANSSKKASEEVKAITTVSNDKLDAVKDKAEENQSKLESIHNLSNGTMTEMKNNLLITTQRNEYLNKIIDSLVAKLPPGALEEAHRNLYRRSSDLVGSDK